MTLLLLGSFGGELFLLVIVVCLLAAIVSFLFLGSKNRSRVGLWLCKGYLGITLACGCLALASSDPVAKSVVLQVPVMLQTTALSRAGVGLRLTALPLPVQYVVIVAPTLLLLYFVGWLLSRSHA
jgi:hypothetical protein